MINIVSCFFSKAQISWSGVSLPPVLIRPALYLECPELFLTFEAGSKSSSESPSAFISCIPYPSPKFGFARVSLLMSYYSCPRSPLAGDSIPSIPIAISVMFGSEI